MIFNVNSHQSLGRGVGTGGGRLSLYGAVGGAGAGVGRCGAGGGYGPGAGWVRLGVIDDFFGSGCGDGGRGWGMGQRASLCAATAPVIREVG